MPNSLRVLIIEDSENDAAYLLRQLEKAGYEVTSERVVSGVEMEAALAGKVWDIVIADYRLPRFEAPSALALLKKNGSDIPFIVISGAVGEEAAVALMKAGASDYLMKDNIARLAPVLERELAEARRRAEYRRSEQLLREKEAHYRALFENSPISLWEEDFSAVKQRLDALRAAGVSDFRAYLLAHPQEVRECAALVKVLDVNQTSLRLYKANSKAELLTNLERIFPDELIGRFLHQLVLIASGSRYFEYDTVDGTLDGGRIEINLNWAAVSGHEDDLSRVIVSVQDISQRKRSEQQLRQAETKLRSLVEQVPAIVYTELADEPGRIEFMSPQIEALTGYAPALWLDNLSFSKSIVHPDDLELYTSLDEATARTGEPFQAEYRLLTRDGNAVWVRDEAVLIRDENGQPLFWQGVIHDISEMKHAEAGLLQVHAELERRVVERTADLKAANLSLEKAASMKDEFLAGMSHELRTPLTGILGLSEVLQLQSYGELSEKQMAALKHISASGRHLLELINDILDLTRIEARQLMLRPGPCQLVKICQSCLNLVSAQAQQKNHQTSFSIIPDDLVIQADPQRLKQMLANLLSNAVKFTPAGGSFGIEVTGSQAERLVRITVWDTGIGIRAEDMPRLFQTFVQLDASLARQYNGTGLGLALVKRLAELHNGSVSVESAPGAGSRFTINLPWES